MPRKISFSARECQIYNLVADGLAQKEIAFRLRLSPKTVNTHLAAIARKLGLSGNGAVSRHAAVARAGAEWVRLAEEEGAYQLAVRIRQSYGYEDVGLAEVLRQLEAGRKADLAA